MKNEIVLTKPFMKFRYAVQTGKRMTVVYGPNGAGKTTAMENTYCKYNGVLVRMTSVMNRKALLSSIAHEFGIDSRRKTTNEILDAIVQVMAVDNRPLFIDEADYLIRSSRVAGEYPLLDVIRDIFDMSKTPVILVGMENFAMKLHENPQFSRRITEKVRFEAIDRDDAQLVAQNLCEVEVGDDLIGYALEQAKHNMDRFCIGLEKIEQAAKTSGLKKIDKEQWGKAPLYFDQSTYTTTKRNGGKNG